MKNVEIGAIHFAHVYFDWSSDRGFGQLSFGLDPETGKLTCMNECLSRDSVRELLHALADHIADNAEFDE